jgi:hypothetical protein
MGKKQDPESILMVKETKNGIVEQKFNPNMFRYLKEIEPGIYEGGWRKADSLPPLPEVEAFINENKKKEAVIAAEENEMLKQRISELETEIIVLKKQLAEKPKPATRSRTTKAKTS